jgi:tetratricopeptide (TPR) repeat protein
MIMRYLLFGIVAGLLIACGETSKTPSKTTDIDKLIKMYPDSVPVLIQHGTKMMERYDYDAALKDGAKAYRLQPNNIEARYLYADALNNRATRTPEDVAQAQTHFKFVIKKQPKNLKALIDLASTYSYQGDFEKSFQYINTALRIDKKYRDAYVLKGSNYMQLAGPNRDPNNTNRVLAKSSYQTAIDQDPEFFEAYIFLGSLYQEEKNKLCIEYFVTATQIRPNSIDGLYNLAYAYQDFGMDEQALDIYRQMAKKDPSFTPSLFQQGWIKQFHQEDIDSAMFFYNKCLQKEPRYVEAWHNLGMCYELKKDPTSAIEAFKKALKYNPEFELSREAAKKYKI